MKSFEELEEEFGAVTHACPPGDEGVTPCCGRVPFELPRWHRLTLDPREVTCGAPSSR
jgi:hypothetical protein